MKRSILAQSRTCRTKCCCNMLMLQKWRLVAEKINLDHPSGFEEKQRKGMLLDIFYDLLIAIHTKTPRKSPCDANANTVVYRGSQLCCSVIRWINGGQGARSDFQDHSPHTLHWRRRFCALEPCELLRRVVKGIVYTTRSLPAMPQHCHTLPIKVFCKLYHIIWLNDSFTVLRQPVK